MPSIITHASFGQDVYAKYEELIGPSLDCYQAFILGNQGPDPFFYAIAHPSYFPYHKLGNRMHSETPAKLIAALKHSLETISPDTRNVGEAYALGFLCHYLLDSTAHPFVFAWERAFCYAGIEGLTPFDHSDVHCAIETEIDEVVLYTRTGQTVEDFHPGIELLACNDRVLDIIDQMFMSVGMEVFDVVLPYHFFSNCVRSFRMGQEVFYSRSGLKRTVLASIERRFRPHSFCAAMSHKNVQRTETIFENNDHIPWTHPGFGTKHDECFADLYERALEKADTALPAFMAEGFDLEAAHELTGDINFEGNPEKRD